MSSKLVSDELIARIVVDEFSMDQATRAAKRLRVLKITSDEFLQFMRTKTGRNIPDPQTSDVYNALRYQETMSK